MRTSRCDCSRGRAAILCISALLASLVRATAAHAAPSVPLPPALAGLRDFRGTVEYLARRDGLADDTAIAGTILIAGNSWSLDEKSARYALHADSDGSSVTVGDESAIVGDLFEAEPLANAWAAFFAVAARQALSPSPGANVWTLPAAGIRIYLDATGAHIEGIDDVSGRNHISYVFDDWARSGPLLVPQRILRLREGIPNAAFSIGRYAVVPLVPYDIRRHTPGFALAEPPLMRTVAAQSIGASQPTPLSAALQMALLGSVLLLGIFFVAWTRRDALVLALCRTVARDPRGWRRAGVSIFVGPEGRLTVDGVNYKVGPHFYNRAALVQLSTLFLRVSAPGVPRAVILARRFRPIDLGIRSKRNAALGFTLIETMLATALFVAVIMLAIYPALLALSHADDLAQRRAQASSIAFNALSDEQAASAYGVGTATGTTTTTVDGFSLIVTVASAGLHNVNDLDILVADASGSTLAHVVSMVGPPVVAPPHSSGGPSGG